MKNEEILRELREKFGVLRKELKFKASFEDIDRIFYIEDCILRDGFVSNQLSRQLCSRIVETYNSWAGYLHNLIMPNPGNIAAMMESKLFSEKEKKEIGELFKKCMTISSQNSIIGLSKKKEEETKFIDDAVSLWGNSARDKLTEIMRKVNENWKND
jgi:hypothetical protein